MALGTDLGTLGTDLGTDLFPHLFHATPSFLYTYSYWNGWNRII
jgi:hypothetical protein